jgi:hypothetical protein
MEKLNARHYLKGKGIYMNIILKIMSFETIIALKANFTVLCDVGPFNLVNRYHI